MSSLLFITYTLPTLMLWISAEQWASHSSSRSSSRVASRLSEKLSTRRSFSTSHLIRPSVRHSSRSLATSEALRRSRSHRCSRQRVFSGCQISCQFVGFPVNQFKEREHFSLEKAINSHPSSSSSFWDTLESFIIFQVQFWGDFV